MKKILFLHGFFASGQCVPAVALREAFEGEAEAHTPTAEEVQKYYVPLIAKVLSTVALPASHPLRCAVS